VFILIFLAVVIGSALTLYAWRASSLSSAGELDFLSREGLLLFNNVFLVTAAGAVLLGTLYPLAVEALDLGKLSVGPPYFNAVFVPLTAPLLVLVGLAASVPWRQASLRDTLRAIRVPAAAALLAGALLPTLMQGSWSWTAVAGSVLALWALFMAGNELWRRIRVRANWAEGLAAIPRAIWGMSLAHFGLGLFVLGVTQVTLFGAERDVRLATGATATLGAYEFRLVEVEHQSGPNYEADVGTVIVEAGGRPIAALQPEKRLYRVQQSVMTEAAVDHTLVRDIYVALGDPFDNGDWGLRLYYRPMMRLVWLGGIFAFLGGMLAISDRRYRLAQAAATAARDSTAPATA
jgi:cytochrome c-type biogenesis protein CcmF